MSSYSQKYNRPKKFSAAELEKYEDSEDSEEQDTSEYEDNDNENEAQKHNIVESEDEDDTNSMKRMSMEELLAMQERMGIKNFSKKLMKGDKSATNKHSQTDTGESFKRENKNRPREFPLQRRPAPRMNVFNPKDRKQYSKTAICRDPRFDDLSGKLDVFAWKKNFQFLVNKREKEIKILQKQLKLEKDKSKVEKIAKTIQRMENQKREHKKLSEVRMLKKEQREAVISSFKAGKAPQYISNKERSLQLKLSQFDKLKKDNKVDKYLKRKEKKIRSKEFQ